MPKDPDKIRLVVNVTREGHPELFDELNRRPSKYRTERLRMLATFMLRGGSTPLALAPTSPQEPGSRVPAQEPETAEVRSEEEEERLRQQQEEMKLEKKRQRLKNDLKGTF